MGGVRLVWFRSVFIEHLLHTRHCYSLGCEDEVRTPVLQYNPVPEEVSRKHSFLLEVQSAVRESQHGLRRLGEEHLAGQTSRKGSRRSVPLHEPPWYLGWSPMPSQHSSWSCLSPIIYQLSLQGLLCLEAQALR